MRSSSILTIIVRGGLAGLLGAVGLGCVETIPPAEPTRQLEIAYGSRLYFADHLSRGHCKYVGEISRTPEGLRVRGELLPMEFEESTSLNCYVDVNPGSFPVDVHEVTNAQFQLCVDSGACRNPIPADVDKAPVCSDEGNFYQCPVVSVPHFEATRYCEWTGRRLPSLFESIAMRSRTLVGNTVTTPGDVPSVPLYPTGEDDPPAGCNSVVLQGCSKPSPIKVSGAQVTGAGAQDRTPDGLVDLMGNAAEWSSDLLPNLVLPGLGTMPWPCLEPVATSSVGVPICPPGKTCSDLCPTDKVCVRGRRVLAGQERTDWPVCYASPSAYYPNGFVGSAIGGNFSNADSSAPASGTFSRRVFEKPDENPQAIHGFRCVGTPGGAADDFIVPKKG